MHPKLVIFDCDGVLIDSEVIACRTMAHALTREGYSISGDQVALRFAGLSAKSRQTVVERELGRQLPEQFEAMAWQDLHAAFREELTAMAGVEAVLDALNIRFCVASGSSPKRLEFTLGLVGLHERFAPHIFSSESVRYGKPAPDLFLHAARQMHTEPQDCLVIEDSVAGVQAAQAAGMDVLGFCGGGHCPPNHARRLMDEGATAVFSELPAILRLLA